MLDATCTPADIAYPQDLNLLRKAREKRKKSSIKFMLTRAAKTKDIPQGGAA